ncbi:nitrile hydratase subunit beta [Paenibacillus sp. P26]|nr:nitrile hydratase subunit beta [Paenibacillus sp. P26]
MSANRIPGPMNEIHWVGQLADLKDNQYQQGLLLDAVISLLIEKGLITAQELALKAQSLDSEFTAPISLQAQRP